MSISRTIIFHKGDSLTIQIVQAEQSENDIQKAKESAEEVLPQNDDEPSKTDSEEKK